MHEKRNFSVLICVRSFPTAFAKSTAHVRLVCLVNTDTTDVQPNLRIRHEILRYVTRCSVLYTPYLVEG